MTRHSVSLITSPHVRQFKYLPGRGCTSVCHLIYFFFNPHSTPHKTTCHWDDLSAFSCHISSVCMYLGKQADVSYTQRCLNLEQFQLRPQDCFNRVSKKLAWFLALKNLLHLITQYTVRHSNSGRYNFRHRHGHDLPYFVWQFSCLFFLLVTLIRYRIFWGEETN